MLKKEIDHLIKEAFEKRASKYFACFKRGIGLSQDSFRALDSFHTIHRRPVWAGDIQCKPYDAVYPNTALILQGPVVEKYHFTVETVKLYKKIFPQMRVIVSTWEGTERKLLRQIEACGAVALTTPKPENAGPSNANLQIVSAREGLRLAKKLGCEYACKTRTDQRIYSPRCIWELLILLEVFPPYGEECKKRIAAVSLDTFSNRIYGLSDMFHFGHIDGLLKYWDIEPVSHKILNDFWERNKMEETCERGISSRVIESYLALRYLRTTGWEKGCDLESWHEALGKFFVIVDAASIDLYWPKYINREYRWRRYDGVEAMEEVDFLSWLVFYKEYGKQAG